MPVHRMNMAIFTPGRLTFNVFSISLWLFSFWVPGHCTPGYKGNILITVTSPISTPSHHMAWSTVTGGLVSSGYNVTLLTDNVHGTDGFPNGTFNHALHFEVSHQKEEVAQALQFVQRSATTAGIYEKLRFMSRIMDITFSSCSDLWHDRQLLQRLRDSNFSQVVVVSGLAPSCDILIARYLNAPFVVVISSIRTPLFHEGFAGMPYPSSYVPFNVLQAYTDEMTFFQRVTNLGFAVVSYIMVYFSQRPYRIIQQEHRIDPDKSIMELYSKASLTIAHLSPATDYPRPYTPNFIPIGALISKPPNPLPKGSVSDQLMVNIVMRRMVVAAIGSSPGDTMKDKTHQELEDFVQGYGDHGVIIFTLGSLMMVESEELAETFARVFSKLPQRVLWRHSQKPPPSLGENTKISGWLPQNDLLGHPKTRLLIYHGGSNGVHESVYHGVPMVLIPLIGDQNTHAASIQKKGMGLMLDNTNITEETLMEVIQEVLNNPRYKERATHFSRILHDSPMTPLERAVYWMEHVIKFGDEHLRPRSADMGVIELYMLDVTAFLVIVTVIGLYVNYVILKRLYGCCCRRAGRGTKSKEN